ncbi:hypothetical protein NM22_01575 [Vibrio tubiashii]|nr:hypothetical protein NM22_01575 [Vibrio tubiashii]
MPTYVKVVLFTIALVSGFFASDAIQWYQSSNKPVSLDEYCLVSTKPCNQQQFSVVADKDISHPLIPTTVTIDWPDMSVDNLMMTLEGYEMEMGKALFQLSKSESGSFAGQVILPVCTTESMTWYGTISDGTQSIKISLRMEQ